MGIKRIDLWSEGGWCDQYKFVKEMSKKEILQFLEKNLPE